MKPRRSLKLPRVLRGCVVGAIAACAISSMAWAVWVWLQPPYATEWRFENDPDAAITTPEPAMARQWIISERALAATLVDELFPKPPTPPAPPDPPKLDVQLVAILGEGDDRRAFVRDTRENLYLELGAGSELRREVVLASIEADAAVFTVGGNPVRLELSK